MLNPIEKFKRSRMGHEIQWYLPISMGRFLQILRSDLIVLCVKGLPMGNVKSDIRMNIRGLPSVWQGLTATPAGNSCLNLSTSQAIRYLTISFLILVRFWCFNFSVAKNKKCGNSMEFAAAHAHRGPHIVARGPPSEGASPYYCSGNIEPGLPQQIPSYHGYYPWSVA